MQRSSAGLEKFGIHNQTTLPGLRKDFASIITSFSPRSLLSVLRISLAKANSTCSSPPTASAKPKPPGLRHLINYDIHWNPVRIIQRFGRIDRIGALNERIQLMNFWPTKDLDECIKLEQRVSGRMAASIFPPPARRTSSSIRSGDQMNGIWNTAANNS